MSERQFTLSKELHIHTRTHRRSMHTRLKGRVIVVKEKNVC